VKPLSSIDTQMLGFSRLPLFVFYCLGMREPPQRNSTNVTYCQS